MTLKHSASKVCVRNLEQRDIPCAMELSSGAGWNQVSEDWAALIALAPDTCFALEIEGILAATTSLVCYGQELAWIGMVLTRPEYRGRGFAGQLLERALSVADKNKVATVKLDATDQGIRLYQKLGFRREQIVERWIGIGLSPGTRRAACDPLTAREMEELDSKAVGAPRVQLLKLLSERAKPISGDGGFAMQRPGRVTRYLGPCIALNEKSGHRMIEECLRVDAGRWCWDILAANAPATRIAADFGFKVQRQLTRMVRGPTPASDPALLFAIAGFEVG